MFGRLVHFNEDDEIPWEFGMEKRRRVDDEEAQEVANAVQEVLEPPEEPEQYLPRMLPSRKRELKVLGKHKHNDECFFCAYVGERDTAIPSDDIKDLVDFLRDNTGRMKSTILATETARKYHDLREKINSNLMRGERPLPFMSAATVLAHIRKHQQDPEVKQIVMLETLQEIREELTDLVFEKSNKTGQKRANKTQIECLHKIVSLELLVQSKDPAKMACYSAGARVNPASYKQGIIAHQGKTLYDFWGEAGSGN